MQKASKSIFLKNTVSMPREVYVLWSGGFEIPCKAPPWKGLLKKKKKQECNFLQVFYFIFLFCGVHTIRWCYWCLFAVGFFTLKI